MLRLKGFLEELKVPQMAVVNATGWSKTQISLTLSTGKFPADADKFRADVLAFIKGNATILAGLSLTGWAPEDLLQVVEDAPTPGVNALGEIKGGGPAWVCGEYGDVGHDYQHCIHCHRKYDAHMQRQRGAAIVGAA